MEIPSKAPTYIHFKHSGVDYLGWNKAFSCRLFEQYLYKQIKLLHWL